MKTDYILLSPAAQQCGAGFFIALFSGAGNDKPIYQIADHLGSIRVIKDGNGDVLQRFDYYPFGSESRVWTAGTSSPQSALRYRFGGQEIAGQKASASALAGIPAAAAGSPYLDFGARLYDPRTAAWLSQDPMAEKYYPISPYVYCHNDPINFIDSNGYFDKKWFWAGVGMVAKGSIEAASGISASSTGVGAPVGAYFVVDGVSSIGMGTAAIIYSFSPEAGNQDDGSREIMKSNIPELMGKGLDMGVKNEKPYFETGGEVFSSLVDLSTFNYSGDLKDYKDLMSLYFMAQDFVETTKDVRVLLTTDSSDISENNSFELSKLLDKWRDAIETTGLWQP